MTAAAASASFGPAARSSAVSSVLIYGCLVLGAVFALLPILWGISTSLKSVIDVNAHPSRWIPDEITTQQLEYRRRQCEIRTLPDQYLHRHRLHAHREPRPRRTCSARDRSAMPSPAAPSS